MVRKAAFDSLNLVSGFEEDKKRVDSHQEMPNSCPHLEDNTDYDTILYAEVSPFPFFSVTSSTSLRLSLLHFRLLPISLDSMKRGRGLRCTVLSLQSTPPPQHLNSFLCRSGRPLEHLTLTQTCNTYASSYMSHLSLSTVYDVSL